MGQLHNLLLAYYGDDFTGSTDALEFLSRSGVKTVLFIEAPSAGQLGRYEGLQAIGVAGSTRSMAPAEMGQELVPAFTALKDLGAPHVHYKVCSTFDSSPHIGSIGKAADVGAAIFNAPFIPLLVAAPALGRYCIFGNLFARMGIGSKGEIYRLDRHPSMGRHPVTPADESDLRLHLAKQTDKSIGLIDILTLGLSNQEAHVTLELAIDKHQEIILFDGLYETQLLPVARLINHYASIEAPLFSIGSSGIEMALGQLWKEQGIAQSKTEWTASGKAESMLVVSGSCSPVTAGQIEYALANGFASVAVDTTCIAYAVEIRNEIQPYIDQAVRYIKRGIPAIVHTSIGTGDPRIEDTYRVFEKQGLSREEINTKTGRLYGQTLGLIALAVAELLPLQRLVIAGGDTSSFVARAMGIEAVEMIAPVSPGAPLCRAHAPGSAADGLEVNFKGGQVGSEDYFITVLEGRSTT